MSHEIHVLGFLFEGFSPKLLPVASRPPGARGCCGSPTPGWSGSSSPEISEASRCSERPQGNRKENKKLSEPSEKKAKTQTHPSMGSKSFRAPGIGPVVVLGSVHQGNPFWGCSISDPRSKLGAPSFWLLFEVVRLLSPDRVGWSKPKEQGQELENVTVQNLDLWFPCQRNMSFLKHMGSPRLLCFVTTYCPPRAQAIGTAPPQTGCFLTVTEGRTPNSSILMAMGVKKRKSQPPH